MPRQTDFGMGITDEGHICHSWPLKLFLFHYKGWDIKANQEDWKGAIYKWGGPRPSELERVDIRLNNEDGCVELIGVRKVRAGAGAGQAE